MRTKLTNACEEYIKDNDDFLNYEFEFESRMPFGDSESSWRGDILNQAFEIINEYGFFDDYDDLDFTFTYQFTDSDDHESIFRTTIKVTHLVN